MDDNIYNVFFQHIIITKMLHFNTMNYPVHKTLDSYLSKFEDKFDEIIEMLLGITNNTNKIYNIDINVNTINNTENYLKYIDIFIDYITVLKQDIQSNIVYSPIINKIEELLGDTQSLKYLLSFK